MSNSILSCQQVCKTFQEGKLVTPVLKDVSFDIEAGEQVAIMGQSGAGKSTLLHLMGGLELASSGQVICAGKDFGKLNLNQRAQWRNQKMGFVYQFHHLLPEFTALENVAMPVAIAGHSTQVAKQRALELLEKVGLSHRVEHKPFELSGGERQRVAIARALSNRPECILADEPTGNLDQKNAHNIMQLLRELNDQFGTSLVLVTHDLGLAKQLDRVIELEDGEIKR